MTLNRNPAGPGLKGPLRLWLGKVPWLELRFDYVSAFLQKS